MLEIGGRKNLRRFARQENSGVGTLTVDQAANDDHGEKRTHMAPRRSGRVRWTLPARLVFEFIRIAEVFRNEVGDGGTRVGSRGIEQDKDPAGPVQPQRFQSGYRW